MKKTLCIAALAKVHRNLWYWSARPLVGLSSAHSCTWQCMWCLQWPQAGH